MDIRLIRTMLCAAVTGMGYRAYDTLPEQGDLPLVAVRWPEEIRYNTTLGGVNELEITLSVAVSVTDFARAQSDIDAAMSVPGFGTALQDFIPPDPKPWRSLVCTSSGFVREVDVGAKALACDFQISITAK